MSVSVQSSKVFLKNPPKKKEQPPKGPNKQQHGPRAKKQTKTEKQSFDLLSASRDFLMYPPLSSGSRRCSDACMEGTPSNQLKNQDNWSEFCWLLRKFISRKHGILVIQCHLIQNHPPSYIDLYSISICTVGSGYPKTTWFSEELDILQDLLLNFHPPGRSFHLSFLFISQRVHEYHQYCWSKKSCTSW